MSKYTAEQVSEWLRQRAVGQHIHRTDAELNLMADAIDVLLRERESAVGEYLANVGEHGGVRWINGTPPHGTRLYSHLVGCESAKARVPNENGWLIESAFNGFSPSWWGGIPEGRGQSFTTDPNKAVRFCRKEDAEAVAKHMHMVIVTEHQWIAAAPKPLTPAQ